MYKADYSIDSFNLKTIVNNKVKIIDSEFKGFVLRFDEIHSKYLVHLFNGDMKFYSENELEEI